MWQHLLLHRNAIRMSVLLIYLPLVCFLGGYTLASIFWGIWTPQIGLLLTNVFGLRASFLSPWAELTDRPIPIISIAPNAAEPARPLPLLPPPWIPLFHHAISLQLQPQPPLWGTIFTHISMNHHLMKTPTLPPHSSSSHSHPSSPGSLPQRSSSSHCHPP
jgi:hypothetical protein